MNYISKRAEKFKSSGIRKIFDLAANLKDPVNFSIGQPDFGVSKAVKEKTREAISKNFSQYTPTQGLKELREKIAQKFKDENSINTNPENILVTPGTSAGVFLSLAATINPGDEVIIPDPYFVEYPAMVEFLNGKVAFLDTYPNFQIDPEKLKGLITKKSKAIILNSPNNPTGAVYNNEVLIKIAKIAEENSLLIISDEIYEKFIYDGLSHFSIGSIYKNTITLGGLSKSGGMPGWRLGWATGPSEIIDKMKEIQQYIFVCAPSLVQYGAIVAFENIDQKITDYQNRRDLIYDLLSKKFKIIKPQGAFYIMLEVGDGEKFANWAVENNVLVIPGNAFSSKNNHIRISYATSIEKIKEGAKILLKYSESFNLI